MPDEVARRVPETKDYQYAVADNRCWCLRRPRSVVAVSPDAKGVEAGEGRRAP